MLCKRCKTVMRTGTSYTKREKNSKGYRRYEECPKCHDKIYNNAPNYQEASMEATGRRKGQ